MNTGWGHWTQPPNGHCLLLHDVHRKLYLDKDILWGFSFALFHLPIKVNRRQQEPIKCEIPLDSDHLEMKFTLTPQGMGHGLFHCQLKTRQIHYQVYKNKFIISTESTFESTLRIVSLCFLVSYKHTCKILTTFSSLPLWF